MSPGPSRAQFPANRSLERLSRPARGLARRIADRGARDPERAPTSAPVRAEAEPYTGGSGPLGVLLCHGFTGSPHAMRPWAQHLEAEGFRVQVPRLPGHGTSWQELNRTRWTDWYAAVDRAFAGLAADCDHVFVGGLSMGGALALRLAEQHGSRVAGLALVNPCIHIADPRMRLSWLLQAIPSLPSIANDIARPGQDEAAYDRNPLRALHSGAGLWAAVRADLSRVDQPLVVYKSRVDHVVDPSSLELIRAGIQSPICEVVLLERSYHVATLDYDADVIFRGSADFFRRHVGDRA